MARYYRRRYTRVVKPKKKWATNMRQFIAGFPDSQPATKAFGFWSNLCVNGDETNPDTQVALAPTPTILKTGNYKVQADFVVTTSAASIVDVTAFIIYIPEGTNLGDSYSTSYTPIRDVVRRHPEWILAWKQFGADFVTTQVNSERVVFSSRLKRNLNSGDKVVLAIVGSARGTANVTSCECNGYVQFWTCAN